MTLPNRNNLRIMIFGPPGAGKSTYAYALHKKLNLPLHHLDKYFYVRNWIERDYQEFLTIQQNLVDQEAWIIDGNCTKSFEMRYQRAHFALYFRVPEWQCLLRLFKRRYIKKTLLDDRAEGCPEIVRWQLIKYMWTYKHRVKDQLKNLKKSYPTVKFFEIKNRSDLKRVEQEILNYKP